MPNRTREGINFPTVLLQLADEPGRRWINRALSYEVVRASPADKFNNKALFLSSPD